MIGLEFRRKLVDKSGWDQSFVDGGSTRGHDLARVASGPEERGGGAVVRTCTSSSSFAFKGPEVVTAAAAPPGDEFPFPVDSKTRSGGSGTIRHVTSEAGTVRRGVAVRPVNPFLDDEQECRLLPGKRDDSRVSGTEMIQDVRQQQQQPVPEAVHRLDADESGVTGGSTSSSGLERTTTSDVTAWLDSLEQFESPSHLLLNCSTSSSPSICADDNNTGSRLLLSDDDSGDRTSGPGHHQVVPRPAAAPGPSSPGEAPLEPYSRAISFLPAWDIDRLRTVYARLDASGFYLGRMSMDEARRRLTGYPVGTFLLRDSSDRRFLFSLSVQTRRGTTSIRILYESGQFRLDSDPDQVHLMPSFECVLLLVGHYVRPHQAVTPRSTVPNGGGGGGGGGGGATNSYVFRETTGRRDTPVLLRRALETTPATLAHLCRRRIHRSLGGRGPKGVGRLHLKPSLKSYLAEYPYEI